MRHALGPLYRLKSQYLSREAALEKIDVISDSYGGHDIWQVMDWYERVNVYAIPADNSLIDQPTSKLANHLAIAVPSYRSPRIVPTIATSIGRLNVLENVNPDNVFTALSSFHWRQVFMEFYRCLEAVYFLPWVLKLKRDVGYAAPGRSLALQCRASLRWRENERESLAALLALCPEPIILNKSILKCSAFKELQQQVATCASMSRRLYKIRNLLVHQEDYDDPTPLILKESEWPVIIQYLVDIIEHIYRTLDADIAFEYRLVAA